MKNSKVALFKKTKRLILRPLQLLDHENWTQAYSSMHAPQNEWDETNWLDSELTLKKFKEHLKKHQAWQNEDHFYQFGVFRKDDGVLIGFVNLMDISRGLFQNAYLGYRIYNNHWGQGYAKEACQAAVEIAFKDLKLHRIEAGIEPANKRSLRVAKAIGLRKEGLSPRRLLMKNKWIDLILYAGTSEDFGLKWRNSKK